MREIKLLAETLEALAQRRPSVMRRLSVQPLRFFNPDRRDFGRLDAAPGRAERLDPEARRLEPGRKDRRVEARLHPQMTDEFARAGDVAPDARQEQPPLPPDPHNEAVAVWLERPDELGFARRRKGARMGEDRDLDLEAVEFGFAEFSEARVGEARLHDVHRRVLDQGTAGR